jgi:hypothetical protein
MSNLKAAVAAAAAAILVETKVLEVMAGLMMAATTELTTAGTEEVTIGEIWGTTLAAMSEEALHHILLSSCRNTPSFSLRRTARRW